MLRSQGIPAVLVLGFKGCEHVEGGKYLVRQEQAHAWVAALVPTPGQVEKPADPRDRVYHWLSLDPNPQFEQGEKSKPWWRAANKWVEDRFETYVKNYSAEERRRRSPTSSNNYSGSARFWGSSGWLPCSSAGAGRSAGSGTR